MKKMTLALAAAMAFATLNCTAQEKNDSTRRQPRFNPQEMVQRHTDEAVKKYGLDESQAKKLLELNQKYDTLFMRPMGGPRPGGRPEGGPGQGPEGRPDSTQRRPEPTAERKARMEEGRKQWEQRRQKMEEARKAYDTELQTILTTEQYEKYKADSQRRGPRRGGRR